MNLWTYSIYTYSRPEVTDHINIRVPSYCISYHLVNKIGVIGKLEVLGVLGVPGVLGVLGVQGVLGVL